MGFGAEGACEGGASEGEDLVRRECLKDTSVVQNNYGIIRARSGACSEIVKQ